MPLDTFLTKEIEVISLGENRETNVPILSADASFTAGGLQRRGERGNDKLCRIARDIKVTRFRGSRSWWTS